MLQRVPVPQGKDWEKGVAFTPIIVDSLLEAGEREREEREVRFVGSRAEE